MFYSFLAMVMIYKWRLLFVLTVLVLFNMWILHNDDNGGGNTGGADDNGGEDDDDDDFGFDESDGDDGDIGAGAARRL